MGVAVGIDVLRSATKTVLPFSRESFRGSGRGSFVSVNGICYLAAGSFDSVFGGAHVGSGTEFESADLVDIHFQVNRLSNWLSATFSSEVVNISYLPDSGRVQFKVGRNQLTLPVDVSPTSRYIEIPSNFDALNISGFMDMARVGHISKDDGVSPYSFVSLITDGEYAHMVGTDTFSVGYVWGQAPNSPKIQVHIPRKFLLFGRRINWEDEPSFAVVGKKLWLYSDDYFITGATGASGFDATEFISHIRNHGGEKYAKVAVVDLIDKLNALTQFDREKNVAAVTFDFDGDDLRLSSSESEMGSGEFYIQAHGLMYRFIVNGYAVKSIGNLLLDTKAMNVFISPHDEAEWMVVRSPDTDGIFCMATMQY